MKASFNLSSAMEKAINMLAFIPVIIWILYPHMAKADFSLQNEGMTAQIFEVKGRIPNPENIDQTITASATDIQVSQKPQVPSLAYADLAARDLEFQTKIAYKESLRNFLASRGSPFVACVDTLVELKHTDKILALSNAESGLGKRTIPGTHNYWGVMAGKTLKKMGNNVCEGIVNMEAFLNDYPRKSSVKYADMSFVQMCGLYKQPCPGKANHHWVKNNQVIINTLAQLKNQSRQLAIAKVESANTVHTATAEVELAQQ